MQLAIDIPRITTITADSAHAAGVELGCALGESFGRYVERYIERRVAHEKKRDRAACISSAIPWVASLPASFSERLLGLSDGSGVAYETLAEWAYLEMSLNQGCSSILCTSAGHTWTAHNNDSFVPELWGYTTVLNISDRLPSMYFGLAGDIWATAGINRSQLWLHTDYLAATDKPSSQKTTLPTYGFTVEALETCESIEDVEHLLKEIDRTEGMILFVIDGKKDRAAILECSCSTQHKTPFTTEWAARTNHALHAQQFIPVAKPAKQPLDSSSRFARLDHLLRKQYQSGHPPQPTHLQKYLADGQVERRGSDFATAYSIIACPSAKKIRFTLGGTPAASAGKWREIQWPW